eukprot:m.30714 g.30714  ORF g.30714 m.30714 type:complete len:86 (-) comp9657_c0_seq6:1199-1456(-)
MKMGKRRMCCSAHTTPLRMLQRISSRKRIAREATTTSVSLSLDWHGSDEKEKKKVLHTLVEEHATKQENINYLLLFVDCVFVVVI